MSRHLAGDAPLQSVALNLFADAGTVAAFPRLAYVHFSGKQVIRPGEAVRDYQTEAGRAFVARRPFLDPAAPPGDRRAASRAHAVVAAAHGALWTRDLRALGFDMEAYTAHGGRAGDSHFTVSALCSPPLVSWNRQG